MNGMTPKERVLKFFKKEPVDVMPCFSGMGMVTIQAIEQMGIGFPKIHTSADNMARSAMTSAEIYGFDAAIIPFDMCTVPEALGRGVTLYEDADGILYPTVPTKWATMEEAEIPDDFLSKGRMPIVDEAFAIIQSQSGEKLAAGGWVLGPFTMAGQLIELDILLKGTKKYKEKVEEFLTKMTDLVIEVAQHYQDLGVDYMNIREMGTGTDLLSPRTWKSLVQPNLRKVFSQLKSPKILHICGSTDLIIEMMNDCGADGLSVDQKNNLAESRKKVGNDVLLFGNFDPFGTLVQGDVGEVEPTIKACIEAGADAVWPGCDIWPDVKKENVEAYVQAVREHGKAASPAVGRI
jgi:[methyl-Co(III) methanol-specific corrinoid protein]:coenzyme M methyltransferase